MPTWFYLFDRCFAGRVRKALYRFTNGFIDRTFCVPYQLNTQRINPQEAKSSVPFKIMVDGMKLQHFHQLILNSMEAYDNMQSNKSEFVEEDILNIRKEQPADYDTVYHLVKEAFANAEHTDGNEQNLIVELRKSKSFIPELSLVAVEDGKIVGHILFTKAHVNGVEVLALAPLSVLPEYQNRGIGLSLIKQGHMVAHRLGYKYSVVLGHSKYYPKVGYVSASQYGVKAPFEVKDENFMAICFSESKDKLNGIIEYDKAFGI